MGLLDRAAAEFGLHAVALPGDLEHMPGALGIEDVVGFVRILADRFSKGCRQVGKGLPAELSALHRIVSAREGSGEGREFLALSSAVGERLSCGADAVVFFRRADRKEDVLDVVFGRILALEARLFGEVRIDLALGDFNLLRHLALAQALRRDFVADFIAEGGERNAVGKKTLTELFNR